MSSEKQSHQLSEKIVLLGKSCRIGDRDGVACIANLLTRGTVDIQSLCTLIHNDLSKKDKEITNTLLLFELLNLVTLGENDITCEKILLDNHHDDETFLDWFADRLIEFIMDNEIVNIDAITYEFHTDTFLLSPTCISPKNSGFRNILIEFGIIASRSDSKYTILQKLDLYLSRPEQRKKITEKQLYAQLQKKKELGNRGEAWALEYEKRRITNPSLNKRIKRISVIDVSAGYDIASFENNDSKNIDRFIEVKTYMGKPHFYWSSNEIEKAQIMRDKYYIYLVDANLLDCDDYDDVVQIIRNPIEEIGKSPDWVKRPSSFYVEPINDSALQDKIPYFANVYNPDLSVEMNPCMPPKVDVTIRADNVTVLPNENEGTPSDITDENENHVTFEEVIPEYFRDATMMKAWNGLKDAGYLDGSYRCLEKCSRSIAKYIIWCFSDKMEKRYGKKKTEWAPFENFWGKSNLKGDKNECPKADEKIISKIFRDL